jgi:hypothetical protein
VGKAYENAFAHELAAAGHSVVQQRGVTVHYLCSASICA